MWSPLLFDRLARESIRSRDREAAALALVSERRPAKRRTPRGRAGSRKWRGGPRARRSLGAG